MTRSDLTFQSFRSWLVCIKGLQSKPAGDVVSRCRRVERILGISLDIVLVAQDGCSNLIEELRHEEKVPANSRSNVIRAVQLYADFLSENASDRASDLEWAATLESFRNWLLFERGLRPSTTSAVISRLLRAERIIGVPVIDAVVTDPGLNSLIADIERECFENARQNRIKRNPSGDLKSAVRLFARFQGSTSANA
jgi:hypothetical protein